MGELGLGARFPPQCFGRGGGGTPQEGKGCQGRGAAWQGLQDGGDAGPRERAGVAVAARACAPPA